MWFSAQETCSSWPPLPICCSWTSNTTCRSPVFDHLQQKVPKDQLIKVLYWIATHPAEGDLDALDHLAGACLDVQPPDDADLVRERISIYAMKLLGRITGRIK